MSNNKEIEKKYKHISLYLDDVLLFSSSLSDLTF